ncbi:hypothetical protein [Actinoalloteichus sp. GBA129-24]|uniref:hypothetical protein n=1 Tax=Actinoalloteichus sp. GBA129-24 TaxID=1612551 RepID=UPI00095081B1|nr:hypothetical protein [Actinoalloteichus sp. GBA129-24]APU19259.1 hypothetical protein UA75_06180 [Actinoalloteichus sp. GBA129-24]
MRKIARSVCSMLAVVGVLLTTGGVAAASASEPSEGPGITAASCSGTVSYSEMLPGGIGELTIYYNSSEGGTNSACLYHRGSTYGVAAPTSVQIHRCMESSGEGRPCTIDVSSRTDSGNFQYYAGPVGVNKTSNRCVSAVGHIALGGRVYGLDSGRQGC